MMSGFPQNNREIIDVDDANADADLDLCCRRKPLKRRDGLGQGHMPVGGCDECVCVSMGRGRAGRV